MAQEEKPSSRRKFLGTLAAASAAALVPGCDTDEKIPPAAPEPRAPEDFKAKPPVSQKEMSGPLAIAYGFGDNKLQPEDAKNFSHAVVEPSYYSKHDIEDLKEVTPQISAYVSAGGMGRYDSNKDKFDALEAAGVIKKNQWGGGDADVTRQEWRDYLMKQINNAVEKGCNGVMFDTCDTIRAKDADIPGNSQAFVDFVKDVRTKHPNLKIGMNRGMGWPIDPDKLLGPAKPDFVIAESTHKERYTPEDIAAGEHKKLTELAQAMLSLQKRQSKSGTSLKLYSMDYIDPKVPAEQREKVANAIATVRREQGFDPAVAVSTMEKPIKLTPPSKDKTPSL